jgi:cytochrome c oxidase subunit 2
VTRLRLVVASIGLACVVVAAGCLPAPATTQGRELSDLWRIFIWAGVVVAAIVWLLVTWAIVRHRRRDDRLPAQIAGHARLEMVWTAIPLVTVLALFGLTLRTLGDIDPSQRPVGATGATSSAGAASDQAPVLLDVTAFRWEWRVEYPDHGVTLTGTNDQPLEIVLPIDATVRIKLASADVNHAFFVPAFLFKRDAIPGRTSSFDIRIAAAGTYGGACAEYCGILHDQMPFTIRAVSQEDFQAWLAAKAGGGSALPPGSAAPGSAGPGSAAP